MTVLRFFSSLLLCVALTGCFEPGPTRTVQLAQQGVLIADLSGNGQSVVIGSILHGGSLWDVAKGERIFDWNHKAGEYSSLRTAGLSGDGKVAVTVVDDALVVWDAVKGKSKGYWRAPARVDAIAVNQDGSYAVLGLRTGETLWFDLATGMAPQSFRLTAEVRTVGVGGKLLAAGSDDFGFRVWPQGGGEPVISYQHSNASRCVALSPDGKWAFSSAQREAGLIWKTAGGDPLALGYRRENFTAARFSADGKQLLLGTFQGLIYLVDTATGAEIKRWKAAERQAYGASSSKAVVTVAWAANKAILAVSSDGMLQEFAP